MESNREINKILLGIISDIILINNKKINKKVQEMEVKGIKFDSGLNNMKNDIHDLEGKYNNLEIKYNRLLSDISDDLNNKKEIKISEKCLDYREDKVRETKNHLFIREGMSNMGSEFQFNFSGVKNKLKLKNPIYCNKKDIDLRGGKSINSGINYGLIKGGDAYKIINNIININVFVNCVDFSISWLDNLISKITGMIGQHETSFTDQMGKNSYEINNMFIVGQNHSKHLLQ